MSEENILDYTSLLVIMEDILETFPIKDIEEVFYLLENTLKTQSQVTINLKKLLDQFQ